MNWQRYYEWHATYGPPGGLDVQMEAFSLALNRIATEINNALLPAIKQAGIALAEFSRAYRGTWERVVE